MEYPKLYLEWVEHLVSKKLYGAWIKDVSTFEEYQLDGWQRQLHYITTSYSVTYSGEMINFDEKTIFNARNMICAFERGEEAVRITIQIMVNGLKNLIGTYRITNTHWTQVYKDFYDKKHPKVVLSRKLSKKLYRATNKVRSGKHYCSCYEDQPWYDKSYEKNKFSKKAWRK